jgi:hypothetical protein
MITDKRKGLFSRLLTCLMVLWAAGCGVAVPTRPDVEVVRSQAVRIDEGAVISIGPRRLLKELSNEITKARPDIEIIEGLLFRDTVFPEGGWKLEALFQPGVSRQVSDTLGVEYLVLTGELKLDEGEEEGFLVPLLAGAMSIESESMISAVIMDMKTGKLVSRLDCKARGTTRMVYYVIFIAGSGPMLESGVTKGLAREIGKVITELAPPGKRRVAVLALEYPGRTGETVETVDDALLDQTVRSEIYAHLSDEELRARAELGTKACQGKADMQLQRYFGLVATAPAAARPWLCKSADQGHPEARYRLALLYENGDGDFEKDLVKAYMWYVLAGESGKYWGGRHALRLKQEVLGPEELAEAQNAVQQWRPGQCEIESGLRARIKGNR